MEQYTKPETSLIHLGEKPSTGRCFVNPPVQRGSTVVFPSVAELTANEDVFQVHRYGRQGTPTNRAFEHAICQLEGGYRTFSTSSGLTAITFVLTAFTKAGSHLLVTDNSYGPTREYCSQVLARFGVDVEFFDPRLGARIAELFRPNTALLFMESPGSYSFEMTDIPAMAGAARAAGIPTAVDNTWATPLFFRPLEHGADISIHSATKYIMGHADGMMGVVTVNREHEPRLNEEAYLTGTIASPDDAYLGLRGLRTLAARLACHQMNALALTTWLETRPEMDQVLYPALPSSPDHEIWKRDYSGASGLFGVVLKPMQPASVAAAVDAMKLFAMGFSWGGFESLIVPMVRAGRRSATPWPGPGTVIRFHAGLENVDDLKADLEQAFAHLKAS
jgi:cystathionine beta-lyase